MSLPSPEELQSAGYLKLPAQGDYGAGSEPLAMVQMRLHLRIAEGKLAAISTYCHEKADVKHARAILAIIGTEGADHA